MLVSEEGSVAGSPEGSVDGSVDGSVTGSVDGSTIPVSHRSVLYVSSPEQAKKE